MARTPWNPDTTAIVCVECQNGVLGAESVLPALAADSSDLVVSVQRLLAAASVCPTLVLIELILLNRDDG